MPENTLLQATPVEDTEPDESAVTGAQFERLVRDHMGESSTFSFRGEELSRGHCRIRLLFHEGQLRPGGTIAGPVMFTLADTVLYALTMSVAGLEPLAVTSDLTLHFLRKPAPVDLIGVGRLLKASGRRLMGDVSIFSDGEERPVAHATGSYAVPSRSKPQPKSETESP